MTGHTDKIDFVITWVDGNDPKWKKNRDSYKNQIGDSSDNRFRDWGLLKYWFRGVEKFAPWVNKIHFVTVGHIPDWLDMSHPKLNIVRHKDFIPDVYLPTFNTNTIELNLHRIKELSEEFVYFNDDVFLLQAVKKENFFVNKLPCDSAVLTALQPTDEVIDRIVFNNIKVINRHFDKNTIKSRFFSFKYGKYNLKSFLMLPFGQYSMFHNFHCHLNFKKSVFDQLWRCEKEVLDKTSHRVFRTHEDSSIWLMRYWQLASGEFKKSKVNDGYYEINDLRIGRIISEQKKISICLNDVVESENITTLQQQIIACFEKILFAQSEFEIKNKKGG